MTKFSYLFSILCIAVELNAQTIQKNLYVTNGVVLTTAVLGNNLFIGGGFNEVGENSGSFAEVDTSMGRLIPSLPVVGVAPSGSGSSAVHAAIPDGSGGWYIGGSFSNVGGIATSGLAHINSDNTVDPNFTPFAQNGVYALALSGSTLYVGGFFSILGDSSRSCIGAIDVSTGKVTSWNPDANNSGLVSLLQVNSLALSGSVVYVGGSFTSIGDSTRYCIAAIDKSTGLATSWNANSANVLIDEAVDAIGVANSAVYVAGNFLSMGDSTRYFIAALNPTTGLATSWNPNQDSAAGEGQILSLSVSGSVVYAGGTFTFIGGQPRNRIAALDVSTGLATAWNPVGVGSGDDVWAIAVSGSSIYIGGNFLSVGDSTRYEAAAFNTSTGLLTSWNPGCDMMVWTIVSAGSSIYVGGQMSMMNTQIRNNLAAINLSNGEVTDWNPNANLGVIAMLASGSKVYVGGSFSTIGGQTRNGLAAVDTVTGLPTSWNPKVFGGVRALAASGSIIYVGGDFLSVNAQQRHFLISVDSSTGFPTAWNPNSDGGVYSIVADGPVVYVGGDFFNIGDSTRHKLAALDSSTGLATSWNPNANYVVGTLAKSGNIMYAGGSFTTIGDSLRNNIAAISLSSGAATSWNPNANSFIYSIAPSNNTVYVGGDFTNIGGQTRNYIAALDPSTGIADSWNPKPDYDVETIALSNVNSSVYFGGKFASVSGLIRPYLSGVAENTSPVLSPPVLISPVIGDTLSVVDSTLIWHSSSNAGNYEVQIAKDLDFASIVVDSSGLADTIFTPHKLTKGATYYWRVRASNVNGNSMFSAVWHFVAMFLTTDVEGGTATIPKSYALKQNYPNPFNPSTTIGYQLSAFSHVSLKVYDVLGREVATLVDKEQRAGVYSVQLSADRYQLTSGVYFYRLNAGNFFAVKKLILLK